MEPLRIHLGNLYLDYIGRDEYCQNLWRVRYKPAVGYEQRYPAMPYHSAVMLFSSTKDLLDTQCRTLLKNIMERLTL